MGAEIKRGARDDGRVKIVLGHINADKGGHAKHAFWLDLIKHGASSQKR